MQQLGRFIFSLVLVVHVVSQQILWYNGDCDGNAIVPDIEGGPIPPYVRVWDDFVVTDPSGWFIQSIFGNIDLQYPTATVGHWEIRTGISTGNPGAVVASGSGPVTFTPVLGGLVPYENTVQIDNVNVLIGPGSYFLLIDTVLMAGGGPANGLCTTSGANAVGQPAGNNGNSWISAPALAPTYYYVPGATLSANDLSMGLLGQVASIPCYDVLEQIPLVLARAHSTQIGYVTITASLDPYFVSHLNIDVTITDPTYVVSFTHTYASTTMPTGHIPVTPSSPRVFGTSMAQTLGSVPCNTNYYTAVKVQGTHTTTGYPFIAWAYPAGTSVLNERPGGGYFRRQFCASC